MRVDGRERMVVWQGGQDYIRRGYNLYYCYIIIKIKPKKEPMREIFYLTYIKIEERPMQIKSVSDLFI